MTAKSYMIPANIWFELPFPVFLDVKERRQLITVDGERMNITLRVRNDIVKVYEADFYDSSRSWEQYIKEAQNSTKTKTKLLHNAPRFISRDKFNKIKDKSKGNRLHGIEGKTFVQVSAKVGVNMMPPRELILPFLFPWMNEIVTTYRISVLPYLRYPVDTISEANLFVCFIKPSHKSGVMQYGFSVRRNGLRPPQHFLDDFGIDKRYKKLRNKISESEVTFSLAFPLQLQRRYREALLVAYSSLESLLRELVFALTRDKKIAEILWKSHRNRSDDVFKLLLPMLGAQDVVKMEPSLWERFRKAREARNASAHTAETKDTIERDVRGYLETFYEMCVWLISQSKSKIRPWNLELTNLKTGEVLKKQFPL
jgi:hypothetical protein